jgi:hypothetical protein
MLPRGVSECVFVCCGGCVFVCDLLMRNRKKSDKTDSAYFYAHLNIIQKALSRKHKWRESLHASSNYMVLTAVCNLINYRILVHALREFKK